MTNYETLISIIEQAEADAMSGCGQSDVLFESRVQDAYAYILQTIPECEKAEVMNILMARGFNPDFESFDTREGDCSLTGIEEHCCPCGRHP